MLLKHNSNIIPCILVNVFKASMWYNGISMSWIINRDNCTNTLIFSIYYTLKPSLLETHCLYVLLLHLHAWSKKIAHTFYTNLMQIHKQQ